MNAVSPFVSYARNFEDAVLWRALKHTAEGFYIDVGTKDPKLDSVTRAFYERGWRGINIATTAACHRRLEKDRTEDHNVHAIIGEKAGIIRFIENETSARLAMKSESLETPEQITTKETIVPVITLNELLADHPSKEIHFLKIDVASLSSKIPGGLNLEQFRPWIILIAGSKSSHLDDEPDVWQQQLQRKGYVKAHQDTSNHYYVAEEHQEILEAPLATQPKVFDEWIVREKSHSRAPQKSQPTEVLIDSFRSNSTQQTPHFWNPAADDFRRADYWIRELIEVNRRHLSSIREALGKGRKKIKGYRLGKPLQKAKKSLEGARRKHFSEMSLNLEDAEPKVSWPKRWLKSWFRPQGSVNKSLFASVHHLLKAHEPDGSPSPGP